MVKYLSKICRCDGIGRRSGLKIRRWRHRAGSTPASGTKKEAPNIELHQFAQFNIGCFFLCKISRIRCENNSDKKDKYCLSSYGILFMRIRDLLNNSLKLLIFGAVYVIFILCFTYLT